MKAITAPSLTSLVPNTISSCSAKATKNRMNIFVAEQCSHTQENICLEHSLMTHIDFDMFPHWAKSKKEAFTLLKLG